MRDGILIRWWALAGEGGSTTMKPIAAIVSPALLAATCLLCAAVPAVLAGEPSTPAVIDHTVTTLEGDSLDLASLRGKPLLIVNTASKCGYTPQYAGLERLHERYAARGLVILGFPSNDFGGQEPGDAAQIKTFCTQKYGVTFPMFNKVVTKDGPDQSPVYAYLGAATGQLPTWNFAKYVVGKDGKPIAFFNSKVSPDDAELLAAIDQALAAR
jgi:glutathione peroxidase